MSEPTSVPDRALGAGASGEPGDRHRVVIVGGGFGGVRAAHALSDLPVDITLIDRTNHHLFQPLLYQVWTGVLSPGQIGPALRSIFRNKPNGRVQLAQVDGFDLDRRVVQGVADHGIEVPYDTLIVGDRAEVGRDRQNREGTSRP